MKELSKLRRHLLSFVTLGLLSFLLVSNAVAGPQTASSTTGTNMIARARVYLDESTALKWSDATLLRFLNDGMVDIANKTLCYQGTESVSLTANTIEYTPTTDYIKVIAVKVNPASGSSWGLIKGNVTSVGLATEAVTPVYWYEFAGKVGIYPAYSAVTTETATVYFAKRPADIAAGSNVLTPAIYDKALVYYICAQAFMLDKRIAEANNYLMLYAQELDRYRQDITGADNEKADPIR